MHIKQTRKCVACRESKHQNEMLRISRVNNAFQLDITHKMGGRGAYVCKDKKCIDLTIKKRLFNKSFKSNLEENIYMLLEEYEKNN